MCDPSPSRDPEADPGSPTGLTHVHILWHTYERDETEQSKLIGVYTSKQLAEAEIPRLRLLPGFSDYPDSFLVDSVKLNQTWWDDGFVTVRH